MSPRRVTLDFSPAPQAQYVSGPKATIQGRAHHPENIRQQMGSVCAILQWGWDQFRPVSGACSVWPGTCCSWPGVSLTVCLFALSSTRDGPIRELSEVITGITKNIQAGCTTHHTAAAQSVCHCTQSEIGNTGSFNNLCDYFVEFACLSQFLNYLM